MDNLNLMHPRDQIILIMQRIYGYSMTTTSGGNLSIIDEDNNIWITPASVDKGTLQSKDIVCVKQDGKIIGNYKPSSEFPFHLSIYKDRPDIKAILHAHPPALVSFSIVHKIPNTRIIPQAQYICGDIGYAKYRLPGSKNLGDIIAQIFNKGFNIVILENHGIVSSGKNLFEAFQRFETLDFCARIIIKGSTLGKIQTLSRDQLDLSKQNKNKLNEFVPEIHTSKEKELRNIICIMIQRSYKQQLITSTEGTFSCRINENSFVITPYGKDRKYLEIEDLVLIKDDKRESGKNPSRSVLLHKTIYKKQPEINAVIIAHPPNIMAFGISGTEFNTRTIPESYVVLRDIKVFPYGTQFLNIDKVSAVLGPKNPVIIFENDCVITCGRDLLQAYDRLEVAEFSAKSLIASKSIGDLSSITENQIQEINKAFSI